MLCGQLRARCIHREVETRIGRALIAAEIHDGATITVDVDQDELVVRWRDGEVQAIKQERETVAA
jgi:ATP-dependent Clp protease ATP-binding subunit ClpA